MVRVLIYRAIGKGLCVERANKGTTWFTEGQLRYMMITGARYEDQTLLHVEESRQEEYRDKSILVGSS